MKKWSSKATQIRSDEYGRKGEDIDWEIRPGGMIVQKRRKGSNPNSECFITINVSHGSNRHQITVDSHSTFGNLKAALQRQTGLEPTEQRLLFKGKEKENEEWLHMAGVNDMSKLMLMEDPATKERKMEEMKKNNSVAAREALAEIGVEVDKLSEKVAAVEGGVNGVKRVEEKELNLLIELLMVQLLKLDAIQTHAHSKIHRRTQVVRVQKLVDRLDNLKATISNSMKRSDCSSSTERAKWEAFECGFGSLIPPTSKLTISSTKISQDWELFD